MSKTYTISINKNSAKMGEKKEKSELNNTKSAKNNYEIEKNILTSQNKQIKTNLSKVKSYADIVLGKKEQKVAARTRKKVAEAELANENISTKVAETELANKKTSKKVSDKVVEKEKTVATVLKMPETNETTRTSNIIAEVSERLAYEYDSDAQRVVRVARMGSLFDYLS